MKNNIMIVEFVEYERPFWFLLVTRVVGTRHTRLSLSCTLSAYSTVHCNPTRFLHTSDFTIRSALSQLKCFVYKLWIHRYFMTWLFLFLQPPHSFSNKGTLFQQSFHKINWFLLSNVVVRCYSGTSLEVKLLF